MDTPERVIPPSRSHHVRGWHPVRDGHCSIPFESLLECRLITALATYAEVVRITSQPVTVSYENKGRLTRYTPDLHVLLSSVPDALAALGFEKETYVEAKPFLRAFHDEAKLLRQFRVLRAATQVAVVLLTDLDVQRLTREVHHEH